MTDGNVKAHLPFLALPGTTNKPQLSLTYTYRSCGCISATSAHLLSPHHPLSPPPSAPPAAMVGTWKKGPGVSLFKALESNLGFVPILAEDLGVITPDVVALREAIGAPGMVVLQFAWGGGATNTHMSHNIYENCFVYPGGWSVKCGVHRGRSALAIGLLAGLGQSLLGAGWRWGRCWGWACTLITFVGCTGGRFACGVVWVFPGLLRGAAVL